MDGTNVCCNYSWILCDTVGDDNDNRWSDTVASPSVEGLEMVRVGDVESVTGHGTTPVVWSIVDSLQDGGLIAEGIEKESGISPAGESEEGDTGLVFGDVKGGDNLKNKG